MIDIKFLGRGSAFNTKIGNTSAYIKKDNSLLLIDCGSETFSRLKSRQFLINDIKKSYVLITHLHPDHVGSLGDYIFYNYFINNIVTCIIYPEPNIIIDFLLLQGVNKEAFYVLNKLPNQTFKIFDLGIIINYRDVKHSQLINSYGYFISDENDSIFYSGDTNELNEEAYEKLLIGNISKIYQDTCMADYPGNVHMNIDHMNELLLNFPKKQNIYCMHFDDDKLIKKIKLYGFNYV